MNYAELRRQLAEIQKEGFDDSFASFCAKTFSSYQYPPENFSAARLHAFYLRHAIRMILSEEHKELLFLEAVETPVEAVLKEVTKKCLNCPSAQAFCESFIELWCRRWAGKR